MTDQEKRKILEDAGWFNAEINWIAKTRQKAIAYLDMVENA